MNRIEYPITVNKIKFLQDKEALETKRIFGGDCGDFVSVRPCGKEYKDKTYLGVLLGDISLNLLAQFNKEKGVLTLGYGRHNPAIFVPDLNKIIYGCESWWGVIENEKDLRQITNIDIENIWYVKALKELSSTSTEAV